jgi:phenylalanyl-tRNA synthetase beta chain
MKFNYRWLCDELGFAPELDTLCHTLTMGGIEVEEVNDLGAGHGKIVVGEVLDVEPHPNADKLRLATVKFSDDADPLKLVCGAPNLEKGKKYPLALEGAELPGGFKIGKAKIRGVESRGMLCSAKELEMSDDHGGILELPDEWATGEPFDAIIDTKVTPDRADCLSIQGIARDLAGLMKKKLHFKRPPVEESLEPAQQFAKIRVEDTERCPRYMARVIKGVKIGPSPLWLQRTLEAVGLRPINNAVDVTNYVLLEMGQPLHAFDLAKLADSQIVVRRATDQEPLTLLDGTELKLTTEDLVIADAERPQVLAGVMGGLDSEVTDDTTDILLECALFQPSGVRRSSKRHAKKSDSSHRFERGVDRQNMRAALDRAAGLIAELAGGNIAKGVLDEATPEPEPRKLMVRPEHVRRLLGMELTREVIAESLSYLGFELESVSDDEVIVIVPGYRMDVEQDIDLIEEVARMVGYNEIPYTMPSVQPMKSGVERVNRAARSAKKVMLGAGLHETITYNFTDPNWLAPFRTDDAPPLVPLLNPLSPETSVLRDALLPTVLKAAQVNLNQQASHVALFEVGRSFRPRTAYTELLAKGTGTKSDSIRLSDEAAGELSAKEALLEKELLACVLAGQVDVSWRNSGKGRAVDFYDMKGLVEALMEEAGVKRYQLEAAPEQTWLHPGRAAKVIVNGQPVAYFGQLHPAVQEQLDLRDEPIYVLEANLTLLNDLSDHPIDRYTPLSNQPAVSRALAMVLDDATPAADCEKSIRKSGGDDLQQVRLFDVYRGEHLPEGKKSLAFEMVFRSADRSLTDDEVNGLMDAIIARVEKDHAATIRR